ncbi:hypothetical protein [Halobaculum magnesiiphilum]|uniref:DUF8116 domain-containing protein n=1 Tax=Halobaculum magnesiiphilum TaxID=1017351 RepID=A0A8T8WAK6_9EURY|nr:hypothetical protein [Halobaculum magnesiiphilum]QZP36865.1 hypothetical protein K6T50_11245 [Halobaculum magnesiiphilum]
MSLLRLCSARDVADFAEWYRAGAEYTDRVADGMGFDRDGADRIGADPVAEPAETVAALREGRTDLSPAASRVVAATYLGDAAFGRPFLAYTPRWYRLALAGPVALAARRLRRVAAPFREGVDTAVDFDFGDGDRRADASRTRAREPEYTPPSGLAVGADAVASVRDSGGFEAFERSFVLADAVLHTEWFAHVADAAGIAVPEGLIERTVRESAAYYTGRRESLSPDVRRFQRLLFLDDAWVRDVDASYRLNSALFGVWERILGEERRRLERASRR